MNMHASASRNAREQGMTLTTLMPRRGNDRMRDAITDYRFGTVTHSGQHQMALAAGEYRDV